jgi:glycosyltransferase involved in cell wall biosynthesis
MRRLALVVQRYGTRVAGGAEYHSRWVVEQLRPHFDLTIFTTTAEDYITWEEVFPAGETELDGVRVLRYPVLERRDMRSFDAYSEWIYHQEHRDEDEERWLRLQGPYCPDLIEALRASRRSYDLFLFFTYLYYPTVKGITEVGNRAVLLPTAHDEQAIRLRLFKRVFDAPIGFLLNTHEERRFVEKMFDFGHRPRDVVGMGIEWPEPPPDPAPVLEKFGLNRPFCLSSGRISVGKGHDLLVRNYHRIDADLDLVLFGKLDLDLPDDPRIRFLGFLSEEEKWALTRAACFSIQPSQYESLSLTLLESWSMGVPVLINSQCAVLMDHLRQCGGGLHYAGDDGFVGAVRELMRDATRLKEMGEAGMVYTKKNYAARAVARRYVDFLNRMVELRDR